jgi:hypothetical protein
MAAIPFSDNYLNFHQEVRDDAIRYCRVHFIGNSVVLAPLRRPTYVVMTSLSSHASDLTAS